MNQPVEIFIRQKNWEASGQSVVRYDKEKNGDHLLLEDIEDEKILVALVSNGISSCPCDFLASEMTCEKFREYFIKYRFLPIRERIKESIKYANHSLLAVGDKCNGLASTISLVVWGYEGTAFYFTNLGDSRIYKISDVGFMQITRDDKTIKERNVRTSFGLKNLSTITNYLGREFPDIIIQDGKLPAGGSLLLASDGFYNARKSSFNNNIIGLALCGNLESDFKDLFNKFGILAFDDMTAIIIRNINTR